MTIKARMTSILLMLAAGLFLASCGDEPPTPDHGGDTPENPGGGDEPGGETPSPEEEAFLRIDFDMNATEAHALNGFSANVHVCLTGNDVRDCVCDWGVALSVNRENMEQRPEQWTYDIIGSKDADIRQEMNIRLDGLDGEQTYYCRPYIQSAEGTVKWGDIMQFTTPEQQFFLGQSYQTAVSVMEGTATIRTDRECAALQSKYRKVEAKLADVCLDDFQYSIRYYDTEPGGVSHHTMQWTDGNTLQVGFTYLPPGAKVSFRVAIECDGEQEFLSPAYTIVSRKIPESGMVDMELAVNWAACNLGASSPWDTGNYYTYDEAVAQDQANDSWRLPDKNDISQLLSRCEFIPVSLDNLRHGMLVMGRTNSILLPFAETSEDHPGENGYRIGYYWTGDEYYDQGAALDHSRAWALRLYGMSEEAGNRASKVELMKKYGLSVRPVCPRE